MKRLLLAGLFILPVLSSRAQFTHADLQATGLTCAMCSKAVNDALKKVPFVESVDANIKNSSYRIVFKNGQAQEIDALRVAVEDAGFSVGSLKLTGTFPENRIEKDEHLKMGSSNFHFVNSENKVLNGEQTLTILDKNFLTEKQFKKLSNSVKMECMKEGKTSSCCVKEGMGTGERIYHVSF